MPIKYNTEIFILKSNNIHNKKYDYSKSNYSTNNQNVIIICPIHGEFTQMPTVHMKGGGCNLCSLEKKSIENRGDVNKFIMISNKQHNNKYCYTKVKYISNRKKVIIICPIHGDFEQEPRSHIKSGCPLCANKNVTTEIFIQKSKLKHGDYYSYELVKYKSSIKKVKIICTDRHIFEITPNNHLSGKGCPICRESKGEREIRKYLDDNKISYIRQYKMNECRYKRPLPFDFYLNDLHILIEYDGEQHFNKFRFEEDDSLLKFRILKDNIKTNYCIKNNITLIRINYLDNVFLKMEDIFTL